MMIYPLAQAVQTTLKEAHGTRMSMEHREALVHDLRGVRRQQGYVRGYVVAECGMTSSPVISIKIEVREAPGRKPLQNPLKCPRCGTEAFYARLET
jgi:hypothetical protein